MTNIDNNSMPRVLSLIEYMNVNQNNITARELKEEYNSLARICIKRQNIYIEAYVSNIHNVS